MGGDGRLPIGSTHPPLSEAIAGEIKRSILSGRRLPGERLIEDHLAEELGVSRNPVREALRQLEGEGFVVIVPRKGASVARIDGSQAREIFQVRGALEALSARLAAEKASPADLARLADLVRQGEAAADRGNVELLPPLNTRFHAEMAAISGNRQLVTLILGLRDKVEWVYARRVRERASDSWSEHRRLLDAITRHDPTAAAHIAMEHVAAAEHAFDDEGEG